MFDWWRKTESSTLEDEFEDLRDTFIDAQEKLFKFQKKADALARAINSPGANGRAKTEDVLELLHRLQCTLGMIKRTQKIFGEMYNLHDLKTNIFNVKKELKDAGIDHECPIDQDIFD